MKKKKTKKAPQKALVKTSPQKSLFDHIVSVLEEAKANVLRSVNSNMVIAYWHIGREIVQEVQGGEKRAELWETGY